MKRKLKKTSAFVYTRNAFALLLCVAGFSLALFSWNLNAAERSRANSKQPVSRKGATRTPSAPTPGSGALSTTSGPLTFTDTSPLVPNPTAQGVGFAAPNCAAPNTCSTYTLSLDPSIFSAAGAYDPTKTLVMIQISWPTSQAQYGTFVEDRNGNVLASNTAGIDQETIAIPVTTANLQANGPFMIVTAAQIGTSTALNGTISLVALPPGATACNGCIAPRYQVYEAPSGVATQSGEPSIGVDWNPNVSSLRQIAPGNAAHGPMKLNTGGLTMFTATFDQYRVGFDDCASPAVATWSDIAFATQQITTLDAIGFTDHFTSAQLGTGPYTPGNPATPGRTFHGQLTAGDSNTSYTDDDGANHTQTEGGGTPQGPDHETIGAGPYNPNSVPPPPPNAAYPNAVYYCTQNVAPEAECSRSDDGGLTFGPGVPIYQNAQACSGSIHGHVKVARDGTVYVPNYSCAIVGVGNQGVAVSTDNGITWTERNVPGSGSPKPGLVDPSVGPALNDVGKPSGQPSNTIYFGYIDSDGAAKIAASADQGQHWSAPQNVGGSFNLVNATFPVVVAGDDNRAAFGFLGTTTQGDSSTDPNFPGVWHLYIATTYDAGNSWVTIDATPDDPIQVGPVCNGGTFCSTKRNLLDFNGFDVDSEGRGLLGLSDGCVGCTNSSSLTDSNSAQGMVARQSGGPRLFAAFDPPAQAVPAAPQVRSATPEASPAGVLVSWLEPDNGGSAITAYKIYRGTTSGGEDTAHPIATVPNDALHKQTTYFDTTAITSQGTPDYFYHVTAVNAVGESGFCEEVDLIGNVNNACTLGGSACAAPYVKVQCVGTAPPTTIVNGTDFTGELQIQSVNVGEPFDGNCSDQSLTFTIKIPTMDPGNSGQVTPAPNTEWIAQFVVPAANNSSGSPQTLFVEWDTQTLPTGAFNYGFIDNSPTGGGLYTASCLEVPGQTCAATGSVSADGIITITLNTKNLPAFSPSTGTPFTVNLGPGTQLGSIKGTIFVLVGGGGTGLLETVSTTGGDGHYATQGNVPCSGKIPLAQLSATPLTGNAPLNASFDASGSSEPTGACGTINSYTLDFGDGSAPVTHDAAHPTFQHTYSNPGSYPARLTVGDSAGQTSTNLAQAVVTVTSAASPQLTRVDSMMVHGSAGTFPVNLPLTGNPGIECRSGGQNGNFTLVFTFANPLVSVDQATVTSGAGRVSTSAIGSDSHTYVVNLTGVTNAQRVSVALVNAHDSTGLVGNVSVTMGVLLGDVTGDGFVLSGDYSATRQNSGNPVNAGTCRYDVNADGFILSGDYTIVRGQSGAQLPP